jgi:hypothetical protein
VFPNVAVREWRFPIMVALAAVASTLPSIVIGYLRAPHGTSFAGFFDTSPGDDLTYLSVMKEGAQGHWLWHDLYTSVPHPGAVVYPFYILLGQIQGLTHVPPVVLFQAARVLLGVALVVLVYGFCSLFFSRQRIRRLAFLLAVFGGGISVLLPAHVLGGTIAPGIDTSIMGTGVYSAVAGPPHLAIAGISVLTLMSLAVSRGGSKPRVALLIAGLAGLVCALVYPQVPLFAGCVLLLYAAWERRVWPVKVAVTAGLAAAPYVAYAAYLRFANPVVRAWVGNEGAFPVGNPFSYFFIAYTVTAGAFILAVGTRAIPLPRLASLPLLWIAMAGMFAYSPLGVVVLTRVLFVISVPFGIVGCWGLIGVARAAARPAVRRGVVLCGLLAAGMTSAVEFGNSISIPISAVDPLHDNYVPTDLKASMAVLDQRPPGVVMNLFSSGQFVPPYSGHSTYIGNQDETLDLVDRQRDAITFYRMDDTGRAQFMRDHKLTYLLVGAPEQTIAQAAGNRVQGRSPFQLLFARGGVELFEFRG